MRCLGILLLLLPAASAWKFLSFPHFLLNAIYRIPTSPIPQFILDLHHPWIEENRPWLERRVDAAQLLCDINSTLRPDPASLLSGNDAGNRTYPVDLFRRLEVDNNRVGVSRYGWANAMARLHEMLNCPAALLDVTELHVDIFVYHGLFYELTEEPFNPPAELPGLFADAMLAMPKLRKVHWALPAAQTRIFGKQFAERNLTLPSVRELSVDAFSEYMTGICPGIENLQALDAMNWGYHPDADPHLLLVRAAASAKGLTRFGMVGGYDGWNAGLLEEVLAAMPNLTQLEVRGELGRGYMSGWEEGNPGQLLKEFAGVLAKFPRLVDLSLPDSGGLRVGFDGGPWCGNAYFGPEGRDYQREVEKEGALATERAAEIVLRTLPSLATLRIGGSCANLTMAADGRVATWPWTSGMDEWVWRVIPYTS